MNITRRGASTNYLKMARGIGSGGKKLAWRFVAGAENGSIMGAHPTSTYGADNLHARGLSVVNSFTAGVGNQVRVITAHDPAAIAYVIGNADSLSIDKELDPLLVMQFRHHNGTDARFFAGMTAVSGVRNVAKCVIDTPTSWAAHTKQLEIAVGGSKVLTIENHTGVDYTATPVLSGDTDFHFLGCKSSPTATQYFAALAYLINQLPDVSAVADFGNSVTITADVKAIGTYDIEVGGNAVSGGHFVATSTTGNEDPNPAAVLEQDTQTTISSCGIQWSGSSLHGGRGDTYLQLCASNGDTEEQTITSTGVLGNNSIHVLTMEMEFINAGTGCRFRISSREGSGEGGEVVEDTTILMEDTVITDDLPEAFVSLVPIIGVSVLDNDTQRDVALYSMELWV